VLWQNSPGRPRDSRAYFAPSPAITAHWFAWINFPVQYSLAATLRMITVHLSFPEHKQSCTVLDPPRPFGHTMSTSKLLSPDYSECPRTVNIVYTRIDLVWIAHIMPRTPKNCAWCPELFVFSHAPPISLSFGSYVHLQSSTSSIASEQLLPPLPNQGFLHRLESKGRLYSTCTCASHTNAFTLLLLVSYFIPFGRDQVSPSVIRASSLALSLYVVF
jgi:hypothetical protein